MCGIAGFYGRSPQRGEILATALGRRGPDGAWVVEHGAFTLVQTRLAVIDLSDRVQYPMLSESGDLALIFNGEIYGYGALRQELQAAGHVFATECDAEVVLHGYEEWGESVFARLDGMFAAAITDRRTGELLLVRDALGIKPLVHTTGLGPIAFGSDAIALVEAGLSPGVVDRDALSAHLALHYLPPPLTGIQDVAQLQPGWLLRVGADGARRTRRWAPDPLAGPAPRQPVHEEEVEAAVLASVARQSVADVPVGVFLSGGIDSALILAAAVRAGRRPIAFTIGFGLHGDYDEQPLAARTAAAMGVDHRCEVLDTGFAEVVTDVVAAFDMPFADSSAIATVQLAKLARREVTVALSGTGGDELFAGYARHRAHRLLGPLRLVPGPARRALTALEPARGTERASRSAVLRSRVARLVAQDPRDPLAQYLGLVAAMSSPDAVAATTLEFAPPASMRRPLAPENSILRELARLDLATYLPGDVLTKEDRATMAVGLEARVPLLGADLLALSGRMPDGQKVNHRQGKVALRELATKLVPGSGAAKAPKRGFAVPLGDLFAGRWRRETRELLREADGVVDGARAVAAYDAGSLAPADTWMLTTLSAWEERLQTARRGALASSLDPIRPR